ncbi:MAG: glutamate synthase subunit beta [Saccharofermentans sp.]|nr:glutamate synthase subunit beta [Saccharofermentans sp.]
MGKPSGFLEYERVNNPGEEPLQRIKTYHEFHTQIDEQARKEQAARCMNCGVPFCQYGKNICGMASGCPLNNLCPDWNDMIYKGHWNEAAELLLLTNPFPEFTSRVCPALCEKACTNGLDGDPVTVKENEYAVIEKAYENGLMEPKPPVKRSGKSVAVVGSGPSGLSTAYWLNKRGHSVTVYEKEDRPGGLLMYGIPNMKLEKKTVMRRIDLMKAEGIEFVFGVDVGSAESSVNADYLKSNYDAVVLCCGSQTPRDINVEGRDAKGIYFAVDFLRSTTHALLESNMTDAKYISAKYKNVVVIGGGDTGNDCVGTSLRHGCKSIVQLEMMPAPPVERAANNPWPEWPRVLKTDYGQEEAIAVFGSDPRVYCTTVKRFIKNDTGKLSAVETVQLKSVKDEATGRMKMEPVEGTEKVIPAELVLIAAGFLGPRKYISEAFGLELTPRSNFACPYGNHETTVQGVFAAGDCVRGQSLVVWGLREGRDCAYDVDKYLMGYSNLRG